MKKMKRKKNKQGVSLEVVSLLSKLTSAINLSFNVERERKPEFRLVLNYELQLPNEEDQQGRVKKASKKTP